MLNINKNITLSGVSTIDGVQVAYMSATITTNGTNGANVNKTITNQELYNANKEQVRADVSQFEQEVYKVEDEALAVKTLEISSQGLEVKTKKVGK